MTDAILSEELYSNTNTYERESRFRIDSFRFDGEPQWTTKLVKLASALLQVRVLLCRCQAKQLEDGSPRALLRQLRTVRGGATATTVDSRPGPG